MKESEKLKNEFGQKWYRYGGLREIFDSDLNDLCEAVAREHKEDIASKFTGVHQWVGTLIRDLD